MKLAFYPRERDLKDFKQRELKRVWINPFNDNVENMRLVVAKLELRRSTGGYCDGLVKEDKNVNYGSGEVGTHLKNIWEMIQ